MTLITRFLMVLLLGCSGQALLAQTESPSVSVVALAEGDSVHLRWSVGDADGWLAGNKYGYTLSRMTLAENGVRLSVDDQVLSRVDLDTLYFPLTENLWGSGELEQAAKQILYSEEWDAVDSTTNNTLAGAVAAEESRENRLFFAHAVADRDFQIAKDLALGYTDATVASGNDYIYFVTINDYVVDGYAVAGAVDVATGAAAGAMIGVEELAVKAGDTSVMVGWSVANTDYLYTSYDIYRAPSGTGTFTKANEAPFLNGYTGDGDPQFAWFVDSVPVYGDYDYYVRGNTPFGISGVPSDTVTGSSRPRRLDLIMRLDSIKETDNSVDLYWPSVTAAHNNQMLFQRVYRSASVAGPFEVVSPPGFGVSERNWTDTAPGQVGYYVVELEDEYGHIYRTPPLLAQLDDTTPPAIPTGLTGRDRGDGTIELSWEENTEVDLAGYHLLRCFGRGGDFSLVTVDPITTTSWEDDLEGTIVNDSIFYCLFAQDQRANSSGKTPVIAIARADITPPAKPLLAKAAPTPQGVLLSWEYSPDADVVRHELQRRITGTPQWITVVNIPAGQEDQYVVANASATSDVNYVDESSLEQEPYDYQFIAFDDAGLGAGSEILTIRPYDSGERGAVENLAIQFACQDTTIRTELDSLLLTMIDGYLATLAGGDSLTNLQLKAVLLGLELNGQLTRAQFAEWEGLTDASLATNLEGIRGAAGPKTELTNCAVTLAWDYTLEPGILHFQLYRSRRGSRLRPYKALPVTHFFSGAIPTGPQTLLYEDTDVVSGARYIYKVGVVYADGGYAQDSAGVTVVVE